MPETPTPLTNAIAQWQQKSKTYGQQAREQRDEYALGMGDAYHEAARDIRDILPALERTTAEQEAEIAQQARTIAELRAQIEVLMNGDAIIVPKTIQHARAMYRAAFDALAEFEGQAGDGKEGA